MSHDTPGETVYTAFPLVSEIFTPGGHRLCDGRLDQDLARHTFRRRGIYIRGTYDLDVVDLVVVVVAFVFVTGR